MHRMSFSLTHLYVLYNTFLKIRSMLCCDVYYYCTCLLVYQMFGKPCRNLQLESIDNEFLCTPELPTCASLCKLIHVKFNLRGTGSVVAQRWSTACFRSAEPGGRWSRVRLPTVTPCLDGEFRVGS